MLVSQPYFNPIDSGVSESALGQLQSILAASDSAGFAIRVAMINSATDLGTVTSLWGSPHAYADYLGTELSELYGGQVLVVMPAGFGLYGPSSGAHALTSAELAVRAVAPGPGPKLATAAISAVPLLAAADGHPIPQSKVQSALSNGAAAGSKLAAGSSFPPAAYAALVVGLLLIAGAWIASARVRPIEPRRRAEA